jgi:hypothetical protein
VDTRSDTNTFHSSLIQIIQSYKSEYSTIISELLKTNLALVNNQSLYIQQLQQAKPTINIEAASSIIVTEGSSVDNVNISFQWNEYCETIDRDTLTQELRKISDVLKQTGKKAAQENILSAIEASSEKKDSKLKKCLVQAGKTALDVAIKIGAPLATEVIKKALGII